MKGEQDKDRVKYCDRPKSGFIKFCRKIKTEGAGERGEKGLGHYKNSKSEYSGDRKNSKSEYSGDRKNSRYFPRRPKTCGDTTGNISIINEDLRIELLQ